METNIHTSGVLKTKVLIVSVLIMLNITLNFLIIKDFLLCLFCVVFRLCILPH